MTGANFQCIELSEWQTKIVKGASLTEGDRALARRFLHDQLSGIEEQKDGRLVIDELKSGVRISTRSWVGVIRFESFEVRISPKLVGGEHYLVDLLGYTSNLSSLRRITGERFLQAGEGNLFDLIALLFALEVEKLAKQGLLTDYVERTGELGVIRGRLLPDRQVLERFGRVDQLICRYDERSHDIWENQLINVALRFAERRVVNQSVSSRLRRLRGVFEPICSLKNLALRQVVREDSYNRMNARYQPAHGLALLILEGMQIEDILASGQQRSFAFLLDMNRLFELFIHKFLKHAFGPFSAKVHYQSTDKSVIRHVVSGKSYAKVIPDVLVRWVTNDREHTLPLDAKYKLYDKKKVSNSDIYQAFLYAEAYGAAHRESPGAVVIYPASLKEPQRLSLCVRTHQGRHVQVEVLGISIPDALNEAQTGIAGSVTKGLLEVCGFSAIAAQKSQVPQPIALISAL